MKFIVVVAVGAAALRDPSEGWTFVVFFVAMAFLVEATIRSRFGPPSDQAWWFGFSLFGWVHLAIGSSDLRAYLPTYFLPPKAIWPPPPRHFYAFELQNWWLIINILISLMVATLGGTFTSWYAKRWSVSPGAGITPRS